ncbi:MAG: nuclear transport factor 2 family protein [Chloroflexi bacterium]|nr:nuclear transport factor 2 family protein [Chloroflexota bacterium]
MTHPNADLLNNSYDALARGDIDGAVTDFTDDVMFNIPGNSPLAGEYRGKEQVIAYLRGMMDRSGGTALSITVITGVSLTSWILASSYCRRNVISTSCLMVT